MHMQNIHKQTLHSDLGYNWTQDVTSKRRDAHEIRSWCSNVTEPHNDDERR